MKKLKLWKHLGRSFRGYDGLLNLPALFVLTILNVTLIGLAASAQITAFLPEVEVYTGLTPGLSSGSRPSKLGKTALPSRLRLNPALTSSSSAWGSWANSPCEPLAEDGSSHDGFGGEVCG